MMKFNKELKVGLLTLVSIAILYIGFNFLKSKDVFSRTEYYYTVLPSIDGLKKSNEIKLNGVPIGIVTNTSIINNKEKSVLVEFEIKRNLTISKNSKIIMKSQIIGDSYLALVNGNGKKPLMPGDTLSGILETSLMDGTDKIKENLIETMKAASQSIKQIDSLDRTQQKLDDALDSFTLLMNQFNRLLKPLVQQNLGQELSTTMASLNNESHGVDAILKDLKGVTNQLEEANMKKTVEKLNSTLEELNQVIAKMNDDKGSIDKLLNDDSLYINLNHTLKDISNLVKHINTHPKHFLGPLAKSKKKIEKDFEKD